jgi:hypothetical protein
MIEFQYFESCLHADETLANLKAVMQEMGISEAQLKISVVPDIDSANKLGFQGSPSILVSGVDIYTGEEPSGFSYACRIYEFDGKRTGLIPLDFIWKKLAEYR